MKFASLVSVLLVLMASVFQATLQAENVSARIVRVQGQVYVLSAKGEKRTPDKKQFLVSSNETVVTRKGGKAVVQFKDGEVSVLDEESSLRVEKSGWLSQLGGRVYYVFRKVFGKEKSKKVTTKFATIGIRGTTFIVDLRESTQQLALQEGELNLESPDGEYEFLKPGLSEQDIAFFEENKQKNKQQLSSEFDKYKKNINNEFIEYKKSFDLKANKVISVQGRQVEEKDMDEKWEVSFDEFADFSKGYIGAYKELDQSVERQ